MSSPRLRFASCFLFPAFLALAGDKPVLAEKDSFDVVAHLALPGGAVTNLVTSSHFSQNYLYAECSGSHTMTLVDITVPARPKVLSRVDNASSVLTAVGDVALVSSEPATPATQLKKISIVDFSDKSKPRVTREFAGVTSMSSDEHRGLIFLANGEGLWILHRNQATDPELQERYAHDVLYNH